MAHEVHQRLSEVTKGFFRGKLRLNPGSVEVGEVGDTLIVRVKGFLSRSERAMIDQPGDREAIEDYLTGEGIR